MYSAGSVVGKTSTIGIEISLTSPQIFTGGGGQKVRNSASFSTPLNFEPPSFEHATRHPNSETNFLCSHRLLYVFAKFGEVGSTHPWEPLGRNVPPFKIAWWKRAKSPI